MSGDLGMAFSMPGGETAVSSPPRPIDMAHLSRQTMGDRALEQEVLGLFLQQALGMAQKMTETDTQGRLSLAHGLKGSARGVGAFAIAECTADIERSPDDARIWQRLDELVEAVRDFVAAIAR